MANDRLTREHAKALLESVIREEHDKLVRHRTARFDNSFNDEADQRRGDQAAGLALGLLADQGVGARLTDGVREALATEGFDSPLIDHVGRYLDLHRESEWQDANQKKLARKVEELTGSKPSPLMMNEAQRLKLRARSAALLSTDRILAPEADDAKALMNEVIAGAARPAEAQPASDSPKADMPAAESTPARPARPHHLATPAC